MESTGNDGWRSKQKNEAREPVVGVGPSSGSCWRESVCPRASRQSAVRNRSIEEPAEGCTLFGRLKSRVERTGDHPVLFHVTDCVGGGVPVAMLDYIAQSPGIRHVLLWPSGNHVPDGVVVSAEVRQLPAGRLHRWWTVQRMVRAEQPTAVMAHSIHAGLWTRLPKVPRPLAYQPHAFSFEAPTERRTMDRVLRTVEWALARRTDVLVALTPHEAGLGQRLNRRMCVLTVRNAVAVDARAEFEPTVVRPHTVVASGRLAPQKDPEFFRAVVDQVRAWLPDTRFLWIGDGDDGMRRSLESAGVMVTGWVSRDAARAHLAECAVYVHTARFEGFPLSVLEACALRRPVVVRSLPCFEGTPICTRSTALEIATEVVRCLSDAAHADLMVGLSEQVNQFYSLENQRSDLQCLYTKLGLTDGSQ